MRVMALRFKNSTVSHATRQLPAELAMEFVEKSVEVFGYRPVVLPLAPCRNGGCPPYSSTENAHGQR